jgi:hypothetical protein
MESIEEAIVNQNAMASSSDDLSPDSDHGRGRSILMDATLITLQAVACRSSSSLYHELLYSLCCYDGANNERRSSYRSNSDHRDVADLILHSISIAMGYPNVKVMLEDSLLDLLSRSFGSFVESLPSSSISSCSRSSSSNMQVMKLIEETLNPTTFLNFPFHLLSSSTQSVVMEGSARSFTVSDFIQGYTSPIIQSIASKVVAKSSSIGTLVTETVAELSGIFGGRSISEVFIKILHFHSQFVHRILLI